MLNPKYALVYWIEEKHWSIVQTDAVLKVEMLFDTQAIGLVEHSKPNCKPPKGGWPKYRARVLAVSGAVLFFWTICHAAFLLIRVFYSR